MATSSKRIEADAIWIDTKILSNENSDYRAQIAEQLSGRLVPCGDIRLLSGIVQDLDNNGVRKVLLISSGSASDPVLKAINTARASYSVIIFCFDLQKWQHLGQQRSVVGVYNSIDGVLECLRNMTASDSVLFLPNDCPVVTLEYHQYTRIVPQHRRIAGCIGPNYRDKARFSAALDQVAALLPEVASGESSGFGDISIPINSLKQCDGNDSELDWQKHMLSSYVGETPLCYFITYLQRRVKTTEYEACKTYIGALMHCISQVNVTDCRVNSKTTLYRQVKLNRIRLNEFLINQGRIVCFPAFTSAATSPTDAAVFPTAIPAAIDAGQTDLVQMEIDYDPANSDAFTRPVFVDTIVSGYREAEVLFNAFSFFRIVKVTLSEGMADVCHVIKLYYIAKCKDFENGLQEGKTPYFDEAGVLLNLE